MKNKLNLALYRLSDAKEKLISARILHQKGRLKDSVSRSYYTIFSLATKSADSAKHSGVIALLNQNFVKTGVLPKEYGKLLAKAKNIREEGDYGDFVVVSKDESKTPLEQADDFIVAVEKILETK